MSSTLEDDRANPAQSERNELSRITGSGRVMSGQFALGAALDVMQPLEAIGMIVRAARVKRGRTQQRAASEAAVSRKQWALLEKGQNVSVEFLRKVARTLEARGSRRFLLPAGGMKARERRRSPSRGSPINSSPSPSACARWRSRASSRPRCAATTPIATEGDLSVA